MFAEAGISGVDGYEPNGIMTQAALEQAHDAWAERVRRTVPADRLLELSVTDVSENWQKLCSVLRRKFESVLVGKDENNTTSEHIAPSDRRKTSFSLKKTIMARCDNILASGQSWPHVNETAKLKFVFGLFGILRILFLISPVLALCMVGFACTTRWCCFTGGKFQT